NPDSSREYGSVPFSRTLPPLGASSVPMINNNVLLPDPLGPRIAVFWPPDSDSEISRSTISGSPRVGKALPKCSTTSSAIARYQCQRSQAVKSVLDIVSQVPLRAAKPAGFNFKRLGKPPDCWQVNLRRAAEIFECQQARKCAQQVRDRNSRVRSQSPLVRLHLS